MWKYLEIPEIRLLGIIENGKSKYIVRRRGGRIFALKGTEVKNTEAFQPHSYLWGEKALRCGGSRWKEEHRQRSIEDLWTCGDVLFLRTSADCIFLYIRPRMVTYYLILYKSFPKLLVCGTKNQVNHMCNFKNYIYENTF